MSFWDSEFVEEEKGVSLILSTKGDEASLELVLDQDDIIQECKTLNPKLIDLLE